MDDPSHTCALPSQKDAWTIHGIWPTKLGTRGPGFCNSSAKFDDKAIEPIKMQLEQYWINIEKGKYLCFENPTKFSYRC